MFFFSPWQQRQNNEAQLKFWKLVLYSSNSALLIDTEIQWIYHLTSRLWQAS